MCANVQVDEQAMMVKALKSFKDTGDFDAATCEWEAKPAVMQTYTNLKMVMCAMQQLHWSQDMHQQ